LAMLTSRTNTLLSIPMLFMMVAQSHGGLWAAAHRMHDKMRWLI